MLIRCLALMGLVVGHYGWSAPELQKLLDAKAAVASIEGHDPEARIEAAENAFKAHMVSFADREAGMPPEGAAEEWLALLDQAIAVPHRSHFGVIDNDAPQTPLGSLSTVMSDLPGPDSWPYIQEKVEKWRPSLDKTALQILCARLLGDNQKVIDLCKEYDRRNGTDPNLPEFIPSLAQQISLAAQRRMGPLNDSKSIAHATSIDRCPTLTDFVPTEIARQALYLVLKSNWELMWYGTDQNRKLAQQIYRSHIKEFKAPIWSLADDDSDLPFLQMLIQHYGFTSLVTLPSPGVYNGPQESARQVYFRYSVREGNLGEAARILGVNENPMNINASDWGQSPGNIDKAIERLQARLPNKDLWQMYAQAAIACGHIPQAVARFRALVSSSSTSNKERARILSQLIGLDARNGKVENLIWDADQAKRVLPIRNEEGSNPASRILGIGTVLGDPRLLSKASAQDSHHPNEDNSALVGDLVQRGKFAEAEGVCAKDMGRPAPYSPDYGADAEELCEIYYCANRPKDILDLLNGFPYWDEDDVWKHDLLRSRLGLGGDSMDQPLSFYAAWALYKTGQRLLGTKILRGLLTRATDLWRAYSLWNEMMGANGIDLYDGIISAAPYQWMPWFGKGALLFRLARIDEAESCLRQVQRIDPDLDYPYRQKLNDLLGQIYAKKGDVKAAERCRKLVQAVILAQKGDEQSSAGLFTTAAGTFGRAVSICPDDPCLQAQLADVLDNLNEPSEARKHILLAFQRAEAGLGENSNDSDLLSTLKFSPHAKRKDLQIFDETIRKHPDDPELFFARGLLEEHFGLSARALTDFKKTVQLDPRHLAAWQEINGITSCGLTDPRQAEAIQLALIRLNARVEPPNSPGAYQQGGGDLRNITRIDLAYKGLSAKFSALATPEPGPLMRLHSADPQPLAGEGFEPPRPTAGTFLNQCTDLGKIADLFHPTNYPFE